MDCKLFDSVNGFTMALRDGEPVDFRPVRHDDMQTIQKGISALSAQSRYFRFFSSIARLSDAQLHYFTEVDQHHHVAWIALAHVQAGHPGLGMARFIRTQEQPGIAEFAIVVADSHQHRGLGTILMAALYLMASIKGIETLRGFVLPENTVMRDWMLRLGAGGQYENGVHRMDLPVSRDLSSLAATPESRNFRDCIGKIISLANRKPA